MMLCGEDKIINAEQCATELLLRHPCIYVSGVASCAQASLLKSVSKVLNEGTLETIHELRDLGVSVN